MSNVNGGYSKPSYVTRYEQIARTFTCSYDVHIMMIKRFNKPSGRFDTWLREQYEMWVERENHHTRTIDLSVLDQF